MEKATFPLFPGAEFPLQKREKDESFKVKQNERVVRHGNLGRSQIFFKNLLLEKAWNGLKEAMNVKDMIHFDPYRLPVGFTQYKPLQPFLFYQR